MALTKSQIEARRRGIGGSDANTIMWGDQDKWRALYQEKVNGVDPVFPQARMDLMEMGHAMEPLTLRWFEREHHKLQKLGAEHTIRWPVDPFFFFTPDGMTVLGNLPVQAKYHTGDRNILDLAEMYAAQLIHEMLCSGARKCYLAVTFGHYGRRQHLEVEQDQAALDAYLQRAMAFKHYMQTGEEPEWMVAPVQLKVPRRRDHVWEEGDNLVAHLANTVISNAGPAKAFEAALKELKDMVPGDAATATWTNSTGMGIRLKVGSNNSKRWELVTPAKQPRSAKVRLSKVAGAGSAP